MGSSDRYGVASNLVFHRRHDVDVRRGSLRDLSRVGLRIVNQLLIVINELLLVNGLLIVD